MTNNLLIERLKLMLDIEKDRELAMLLEVKPNLIATWRKSNRKAVLEPLLEKSKALGLDLNYLFREPIINQIERKKANLESNFKIVTSQWLFSYLLSPEGTLNSLPNSVVVAPEKIDIGFQIIGENMQPAIPMNSYLYCQSVKKEHLKLGQVYVIVSKQRGIFVARFNDLDTRGTYVFTNDKDSVADYTFKEAELDEVFLVKMVFQYI